MIKFTRLQKEHLEIVMNWREKPEVTKYLFTDVKSNLEKQYQWFNKINQNDTYRYWVINYGNVPVGLINLAEIDKVNLRCNAGYYIGEMDYRQIGAEIPPYIYNYVFGKMKFRKIYGEVMSGNINVLKMHELFGFRKVGVYRDHIFKNGRFYDVVLIELLSDIWLKQKRYQSYVAELP